MARSCSGSARRNTWHPYALCAVLAVCIVAGAAGPSASARPSVAVAPIRAAFYYPWFPETWKVHGKLTHYSPTLGLYRTADPRVAAAHIKALTYAGMDAAISSWHGPGHYTDVRLRALLARTVALRSPLRWAVYDEHDPEGSVDALTADLAYIRDHLAKSPAYLRVNGRFVVFAYNDTGGCEVAASWAAANARIGNAAYVDLKVFPGYRSCPQQPSSWHQYAPAQNVSTVAGDAVTVSPGFWRADEAAPRLARDPARFTADVRAMIASRAPWQLVTTFNEWGEGTAIESSAEWRSASGYGLYEDILHRLLGPRTSAVPRTSKPKSKLDGKAGRPGRAAGTSASSTKGIRGTAAVGETLSASPSQPGAWKRARFQWLRCAWTGGGCTPAGAVSTYRVRSRDLGRTLRLLVAPRPGAAALRFGPTSVVLPASRPPTIVAAGDIACDPTSPNFRNGDGTPKSCKQRAVSSLALALHPTAALTLGDSVYECGHRQGLVESFDPSWGRLKQVIHPAIGNHEYGNACQENDPSPYFDYFGAAAAGPTGWYSYEIGSWHFIALNSECHYGGGSYQVGGCDAKSPQAAWLRRDLANDHASCTLAYWHEPRFSSGQHGDALQMGYIWNVLAAAHVDVVLSGHNHDYERFDPIGATPEGQTDPALDPAGIREFVVGTGGKSVDRITEPPLPGEQIRSDTDLGVLSLTLLPSGYRWRFASIWRSGSLDQGTGTCH